MATDRRTSIRASQLKNFTVTGWDIKDASISGSRKLIDGTVTDIKLNASYIYADGTRGFTGTVSGVDPTESYHIATKQYTDTISGAIVTDHGALSGLTDDDHAQYALVDGTREFTGAVTISGGDLTMTTGDIDILTDNRHVYIGSGADTGVFHAYQNTNSSKPMATFEDPNGWDCGVYIKAGGLSPADPYAFRVQGWSGLQSLECAPTGRVTVGPGTVTPNAGVLSVAVSANSSYAMGIYNNHSWGAGLWIKAGHTAGPGIILKMSKYNSDNGLFEFHQNGKAIIGGTGAPTHNLQVVGNGIFSTTLDVGTVLTAGSNDSQYGIIQAYGHDTGSTEGGELRVFTAADYDDPSNYYSFKANGAILEIGLEGGASLNYTGSTGYWDFTQGIARVGVSDSVAGIVSIMADGTTTGGTLRLFNGADVDAPTNFWKLQPDTSGDLVIGTDDDDWITVEASTGNILPAASGTIDLGSVSLPFKDLYLTDSSLYVGGEKIDFTDYALVDGSRNITGNQDIEGNLYLGGYDGTRYPNQDGALKAKITDANNNVKGYWAVVTPGGQGPGFALSDDNNENVDLIYKDNDGFFIIDTVAAVNIQNDVVLPSDKALYFGDPTVSGTWRMVRSGNDLKVQRYDGSIWDDSTVWNGP